MHCYKMLSRIMETIKYIVLHMMLCIAFVLLQPQIGQQKNTEIPLSSRIVGALQSAFDHI